MERKVIYYRIKQLKEEGFNISQIARKVGVVRNTVKKYLKMGPEELETWLMELENREKKLDPYRDHIVAWLKEHPDLSAAQVYDWLAERLGYQEATEGTVRNYLNELRDLYHIPKSMTTRTYQATEELPPGVQGQVDFGVDELRTTENGKKKVYCIGFVLAHSRYKYVEWLDRPFRTEDVIRCHENAFRFYGGLPEEMVYDQDRLIVVSENAGDILMTAGFQRYREFRGFRLYLCRKGDPESKGKIENVIKFVKYNFSKNRTYADLDTLNDQTLKWLERTGNYKVHQTIKKRPSEVFVLEKQHLKRLSSSFPLGKPTDSSITRNIQKDNVIRYAGNRYSVPVGTYHPKTPNRAYVEPTENGRLRIRLSPDGEVIADHLMSLERGILVSDPAHKRKPGTKAEALTEEITGFFRTSTLIDWYIAELKKKYPRHLNDQLRVMKAAIQQGPESAEEALEKAKALNLISANDFRDILYSLHRQVREAESVPGVTHERYAHLHASERDPNYYVSLLNGRQP